jgi:hypothetical protein
VVNFRGLNLGEGYQDGEFSHTENVSSVLAPCLTQRFGRVLEDSYSAPEAIHTKDGLVVIDGTNVLYNDTVVGTVSEGRKQIAAVGNIVVIFPDKVYYNVADQKFGNMGEHFEAAGLVFTNSTITTASGKFNFRKGDAVTISGCAAEGNNMTVIIRDVSDTVLTFYENTFDVEGESITEAGTVTIKREIPDLEFIC